MDDSFEVGLIFGNHAVQILQKGCNNISALGEFCHCDIAAVVATGLFRALKLQESVHLGKKLLVLHDFINVHEILVIMLLEGLVVFKGIIEV